MPAYPDDPTCGIFQRFDDQLEEIARVQEAINLLRARRESLREAGKTEEEDEMLQLSVEEIDLVGGLQALQAGLEELGALIGERLD